MPTENPASLSLLSDEIVFCLFKGKVLVGRCVCKCLRDRLWSAGTASEPVFLRVQPIVRISTRNLASELTFLKSFRHVNVLISTSRNSFESRALFKILKTNFAICTIQEITVSEVQSASRRGDVALLSLVDKLLAQVHPLPSEPVLAILLRTLRRALLGNSKVAFVSVSKRLIILLLRKNAVSELLSEDFFTIIDIFVDIEEFYDRNIVQELVKMLCNGTEMQKEYAMSAIWIFARHQEKVYTALQATEAINHLVKIAASGHEVLKDYALGTLMNLAEGIDEMKEMLNIAGVAELFLSEAQVGTEIRKEYALEGLMHFTEGEEVLLDCLYRINAFDVLVEATRIGTEIQTEYAVEAIMNVAARSDVFKITLSEKGAIEQLVRLARNGMRTALEAVCNFAAGGEGIHQRMLEAGAVDLLLESISLKNFKTQDREDVLWALETMASSSSEIKAELKAKGIVNILSPFTRSNSDIERDHAISALINLMSADIMIEEE